MFQTFVSSRWVYTTRASDDGLNALSMSKPKLWGRIKKQMEEREQLTTREKEEKKRNRFRGSGFFLDGIIFVRNKTKRECQGKKRKGSECGGGDRSSAAAATKVAVKVVTAVLGEAAVVMAAATTAAAKAAAKERNGDG